MLFPHGLVSSILSDLNGGPQGRDQRVTPAGSGRSGFGARVQDALHEDLTATCVGSKPRPEGGFYVWAGSVNGSDKIAQNSAQGLDVGLLDVIL